MVHGQKLDFQISMYEINSRNYVTKSHSSVMYAGESYACAETSIKNTKHFQQLSDVQLIWQHQMVKICL